MALWYRLELNVRPKEVAAALEAKVVRQVEKAVAAAPHLLIPLPIMLAVLELSIELLQVIPLPELQIQLALRV
jgi:hypothetical protein